jgi:diguanylate cyclase (GGDEF)-like protein
VEPGGVDALTGLADRASFLMQLSDVITGSAPGTPVTVYLIDIDRFVAVRDVWGQADSDAALQVYAQRLIDWLDRPAGPARATGLARVEQHRFALSMTGLASIGAALDHAAELRGWLAEIAHVGSHVLRRTATIGLAVGQSSMATAIGLLAEADEALRVAQSEGGVMRAFGPPLRAALLAGARLDLDLSTAVALGQLRLEYQPEIDLRSGHLLATEALVRWQHPHLGRLAPDAFIPTAEQTNLIADIDEWVLRAACAQRVEWNHRFGHPEQIMRVNVSPRSFIPAPRRRADLIAAIVGAAGLAPSQVCLELTEQSMPFDGDELAEACHWLRATGFTIALDDFGTGFSSIPHLKSVPADVLKIDRSFVAGLAASGRAGGGSEPGVPGGDDEIVAAFVRLAAAFDLDVVAEGVQTMEQVAVLVRLGCFRGQGHLIGEAGPGPGLEPALAVGHVSWPDSAQAAAVAFSSWPEPAGPTGRVR